jgi:proteasome lid subunit RPN8/RPN11
MMMIILSKTHLSEISFESRQSYPYECCGALLGHVLPNQDKQVVSCISLVNHSDEDQRRRFKVTDKDYQLLEKKALDLNLTLLGFYHSHPDHPAIPSQTDLNYAWPFFSYIIQSVTDSEHRDIKSYMLSEKTMTFVEEKIRFE